MKVLDLFCPNDHAFEGWFASEDDYQSQLQHGLLQCPLCGSGDIRKGLSAPRLNLGAREPTAEQPATQASLPVPAQGTPGSSDERALALTPDQMRQAQAVHQQLQAAWLRVSREIVARTEDVGPRFAQEALDMHRGEIEERPIRGQATREEAVQLLEEGVALLPLALPAAAKETLQ